MALKCFAHPKEDAVAVCIVCGRAVCSSCGIILSGKSYCKMCVEGGKAVPGTPTAAVPTPSGVASKTQFILGGVGVVICGVAALIHMVSGGLLGLWWLYSPSPPRAALGLMILVVFGVTFAAGLVLGGVGYLGVSRNYGRLIGTAGFALSVVTCVFLVVSIAAYSLGSSYSSYYYYTTGPFFAFHVISSLVTLALFGVTQIIWGVAHFITCRQTGRPRLAMATGIVMLVSGALTASVFVAFGGVILFLASATLAAYLFLTSNVP